MFKIPLWYVKNDDDDDDDEDRTAIRVTGPTNSSVSSSSRVRRPDAVRFSLIVSIYGPSLVIRLTSVFRLALSASS